MRRFGTILIVVGAFVVIAAALALIGPTLQSSGIDVTGFVTSVPGALVVGALFLIVGTLLRRRASANGRTRETK